MVAKKFVIITGVSRGLGRAMVDQFIAHGWTVAGCCRSQEATAVLAATYPSPNFFSSVDVTDDAAVKIFCEQALQSIGTPDLLLNNAALINANAPLWEVPLDDFNTVVDVNIKGVFSMIRHLTPGMLKRGSGVIVNFSSGWGRSTSAEVAPYCATKYAIEGLSQAMAQETDGKVTVVALNPGIIDTDMLRSCFGSSAGAYPDAKAWAKRAVPFLINIGPKDNGRPLTAP